MDRRTDRQVRGDEEDEGEVPVPRVATVLFSPAVYHTSV